MRRVLDISTGQVTDDANFVQPVPSDADLLAAERASMRLTDIQFGLICARNGWMTLQEAEDWCGDGSLPQRATSAIALLPAEAQGAARVRFRGAREIDRLNPLLPLLQAIPPTISDADLDQAFRDGALE